MNNHARRITCLALCAVIAAALLAGAGCRKQEKKSRGYLGAVMDSLSKAEVTAATVNMRTLARELGSYAADNGAFPPSLDALVKAQGLSEKNILTIRGGARRYSYIPGQTMSSPRDNVLVYDERPVYRGKCLVLRAGGTVELIGADDLKEAVAKTRASLADTDKNSPTAPSAGNGAGAREAEGLE